MKSGRTVTLTTEDMQKKKNDVKARTTLLLSFPDEHQLRFKQTFTRLQVIVGQLQFMDVEVKQDDLNQKFLTSLAPEWLMHTIVWRNMSDLDTMSLDDLYNHLNIYEIEVQKKTEPNTHNMAFISSSKHSRGNDEVNTASKEDHALVADEEAPTEFALIANTSTESKECIETLKKELETLKQEKEVVDGKLAGLLTASKDLDNLIDSQRSNKSKEGLGYTAVPHPPTQLYLSPKKDFSWTGLPECADDTVTDYSRPSPTVESSLEEDQNRNPSVYKNVASPITPKPFVNFVKASDSQSKSKIDEKETPKKPPVKYAEQYIKPNRKPNVRGNQRNWNNLKSHQLGLDFVMKKKACFNRGDFNHLAYECKKSGNSNPTTTSTNPSADQLETLTVETPIPTVSLPVLTACCTDSQEPSSETRLILKRVTNQEETPSLDNILTLTNQFEDILGVTTNLEESNGVEVDISNMETTITVSPTPTLRIHMNHPKSQIIGPVDTLIRTRNKSKEVGEQSFIAPKKIFDALQDPSWVEAMQEELLQFKIQK
nr:hypothetical protein [Tanacetum cinerariifolium]